jgi:hypothetical protein
MRRFFTLFSLLCAVAMSLIISDSYKVQYQGSNLANLKVSSAVLVKNNPFYTGLVGVEVFPVEKLQIIN